MRCDERNIVAVMKYYMIFSVLFGSKMRVSSRECGRVDVDRSSRISSRWGRLWFSNSTCWGRQQFQTQLSTDN